jgi:hypothetical protein
MKPIISPSAGDGEKCNKSICAPPTPVFVVVTLIASPVPFICNKAKPQKQIIKNTFKIFELKYA